MQRMRDWMAENAFFVTLGCVLAVIVSSAMYAHDVQSRLQTQEVGIQAAAGAPEIAQSASPTQAAVTPLPTIAPLEVRTAVFVPRMQWPLEGGVLRGHDPLEIVYWEALDVWQAHQGLDIAGKAEETVRCAADGTVVRTALDGLWGWRVWVAQRDGAQALYSGLAVCYVSEGDMVRAGQALGTLLDAIPCERELGPHLHMEITRGGAAQDPQASLEER